MMKRQFLAALALPALLALAGCDGGNDVEQPSAGAEAEQATPMGGQEMDPEMMARMMEAQEIQQQLQPIRDQAMQDPELAAQLTELQERIETAMREEGSELFEQMEAFEADYLAAQEAEDSERAQAIGMEAQGVQMQLQAVQESVLSRPDIQEDIEAFEEHQRTVMLEIDPEAGELMDELDEILAGFGTQ
jgi:hypothetical protein